jgi:hypothetical protein
MTDNPGARYQKHYPLKQVSSLTVTLIPAMEASSLGYSIGVKKCLQQWLLLRYLTRRFITDDYTFPDVPEKSPVQEQVDDKEHGKCKARVIMKGQPLATADAKIH